MIKIAPKIYTTKRIVDYEEIQKTKYKLPKGKKLIVTTVKNAHGQNEVQIKKLFQKHKLLKSILVVFNKDGYRDSVIIDAIV